MFFFRNWQNWGNRAYFPKADRSHEPEEVLGSFLAQFYDDKPAPRLHPALARDRGRELLARRCRRARGKVEIHVPQRGERAAGRYSAAQRARGARPAARRHLLAAEAPRRPRAGLRAAAKPPRRVEVYDNSHIMGTNAVGAMIVAGAGRLHEAALPHLQHEVARTSRPATITA